MDIEEKIRMDYYRSKLPYASKKANPEVNEAYHKESNRLHNEFMNDLREYAQGVLGPLSDDQFGAFFSYVWSEGHSSGYYDVLNHAHDIIDLLGHFVKKPAYNSHLTSEELARKIALRQV